MSKILVVGLNPAWQQVFTLPSLATGGVSRARDFHALASGKGINAAKVLARLGHRVSLLQVLAGARGERCLAGCKAFRIRSLHAWAEGETRACVTLLHPATGPGHATGETTEIIGPYSLDPAAGAAVAAQLLALVRPEDRYDALLVCGTMPPGIPEDFHARVRARVEAPLVIWDSVAGITADALPGGSWLKVNAEEYAGMESLLPAQDGPARLITRGGGPADLMVPTRDGGGIQAWSGVVPPLDRVVNPIGAGDTATALLADGLLRGMDARAAVARALAAASASCLNPLPAEWNEEDAARLEARVRWEDRAGNEERNARAIAGVPA